VKLFEHPDFEPAILRAAERFRQQGLRPAIIGKDYYVTLEGGSSIAGSKFGLAFMRKGCMDQTL
jgi:hypothetical protein